MPLAYTPLIRHENVVGASLYQQLHRLGVAFTVSQDCQLQSFTSVLVLASPVELCCGPYAGFVLWVPVEFSGVSDLQKLPAGLEGVA